MRKGATAPNALAAHEGDPGHGRGGDREEAVGAPGRAHARTRRRRDGRRPSESRKDQSPPEKHRAHLDDHVRGATGRERRGSAGQGRDGGDLSEPAETRAHRPGGRGPARHGPEPGSSAGPGHRRLNENAEHGRRGTTVSPVHPKVRTVRETHPSIERARAALSRPASGPPDRGDGVSAPREDRALRRDPQSGGRGVKGLPGRQMRGLPKGARLECIDNTGAKIVEIIEVKKYRGVRNRLSSAGIADLLVVAVKKGTPETRKQVMNAVVVRQRRPFRRPEGMMVQFEDNACVIVTPEGEVKGSDIKGPVAREAAERWPRVAATASMIV